MISFYSHLVVSFSRLRVVLQISVQWGLFHDKLDALLGVPRQSLYWEALAILQLSLNALYLKSCEWMCSSYSAFDCISWNRLIAFTALYHVKSVKIVMSAYEHFSLFSLAFAVVVVCLFVSFLKQERHWISELRWFVT